MYFFVQVAYTFFSVNTVGSPLFTLTTGKEVVRGAGGGGGGGEGGRGGGAVEFAFFTCIAPVKQN